MPLSTRCPRHVCLALGGPVAPQERCDACVVAGAVELRDEIVGLNLVLLAPPPPRLVVPDSPAAGNTAGDVPAPAQRRTRSISSPTRRTGGTDGMAVASPSAASTATWICAAPQIAGKISALFCRRAVPWAWLRARRRSRARSTGAVTDAAAHADSGQRSRGETRTGSTCTGRVLVSLGWTGGQRTGRPRASRWCSREPGR